MDEQKDVSPEKVEPRTSDSEEGIEFFNSAMLSLDQIEDLLLQIDKTRSLVRQLYSGLSLATDTTEETKTTVTLEKNKVDRRKEEKSASSDRRSCPSRRAKPKKDRTMLELSCEWRKRNPRMAWDS